MKYTQTRFCNGYFTLEYTVDLDKFLTKEEQNKFATLHDKNEAEMSQEEFDFLDSILEEIEVKIHYGKDGKLISYKINDWDSYSDMDRIEP